MTLILTPEEEQLRDSVRRFVAERSPLSKLRELMASGQPYDADVWKQMSAQLGLAGLLVPAEHGGADAGCSALSVVMTELGAMLVSSPLLAVTLAAGTLRKLGDETAQASLLPGIASGDLIVTLALAAPGAARAVHASGGALTGEVGPVLNAGQAQVLLVPAVSDGRTVLFAVDADAAGLDVRTLTGIDHSRVTGLVRLDGTPGRPLTGDAAAALDFAAALANLALASEQLGGMGACLAMTAAYAKIRVAFGQPIGAFQGVKHRLANVRTAWELARAALRDAARAGDEREHEFAAAAAVARVMVSAQYLEAATAAVQLHGGIGFTWEHDAHLYYKNAVSQHALFGGPGDQLDRLSALLA
jgi:alkylation response protein AidB-like acyl-CoA dehydrogenase